MHAMVGGSVEDKLNRCRQPSDPFCVEAKLKYERDRLLENDRPRGKADQRKRYPEGNRHHRQPVLTKCR